MTQFTKILTVSLAAALAFTFSSCSDGGDDSGDGGGREIVETYALENVDAGTFTYKEEDSYEECMDGGVLVTVKEFDSEIVNYSLLSH